MQAVIHIVNAVLLPAQSALNGAPAPAPMMMMMGASSGAAAPKAAAAAPMMG